MSSRTLRAVAGRSEPPPLAITALVFLGLAVSGLVNVWIEAPDNSTLPGVALGSQTLLVVERAIAFFAAWLLTLVVSAQALRGRLPVEISGRGLRYADGDRTQASLASTGEAFNDLEDATNHLYRRVAAIEAEMRVQHEC